MQVFPCDGRKVSQVRFAASFSCENVVVGPRPKDLPVAAISFFDEDRRELVMFLLGPHMGTKDWVKQTRDIRVPRSAREGIVRIGMFGSTGTARFDNVVLEAIKK